MHPHLIFPEEAQSKQTNTTTPELRSTVIWQDNGIIPLHRILIKLTYESAVPISGNEDDPWELRDLQWLLRLESHRPRPRLD